jgi:hypothetical protein
MGYASAARALDLAAFVRDSRRGCAAFNVDYGFLGSLVAYMLIRTV